MPTNRKTFEFIILGCSGGPISGKTCSFLLKPTEVRTADLIEDKAVARESLIAIDAGTGLSSILSIIDASNHDKLNFLTSSFLLDLYPITQADPNNRHNVRDNVLQFVDTNNLEIKLPFQDIHDFQQHDSMLSPPPPFSNGTCHSGTDGGAVAQRKKLSSYQLADILLNSIKGYLITHSHLDHVCSLVINSPAFVKQKAVYGIPFTIESMQQNLFNDLIWPDLVSKNIISLNNLQPGIPCSTISSRYSVTPFEVSHGTKGDGSPYLSTAFLINDTKEDYNILCFGDVESDLSSGTQNNLKVWKRVSPLIVADKLNSIVIECSTIDIPPPLYGHMSPLNLIGECLALRKECIDLLDESNSIRPPPFPPPPLDDAYYTTYANQPLDGLNMIIIHVKETLDGVNPRRVILQRLQELNSIHNLRINFSIALSGISLLL